MSLPPTFVKGFHDEEAVAKMEYRPYGKTDMIVSKLAIGGATFSDLFGEVNEEEGILTVHEALRKGINYVDTAPYYGQGKSEELIGKALRGIPRNSYYLATKIGRYDKWVKGGTPFDYSAKKTKESLEKSLKLLGVDYVDVLQIHDIEFSQDLDQIINETLPAIESLVKEGKVRYIGISAYPIDVLKKVIAQVPGRFNSVLCYARYTLLDHTLLDYIPFFKEQNLAIVCASVHAIGLLTNKGALPTFCAQKEIKDICAEAAKICKQNNVELGKLAMYYALQLSDASTFLVGMQTRKLLNINLDAVTNGLTEKEHKILAELKEKIFTKSMNWEGIEIEIYKKFLETNCQ